MRKVIVRRKAEYALENIAYFIESRNLPDSSDKWMNDILNFILEHAALKINFPLCKNRKLAAQKLSCIIFNHKWVIAFKTTKSTFTIYQVIYGANLR